VTYFKDVLHYGGLMQIDKYAIVARMKQGGNDIRLVLLFVCVSV